MSSRRKIELIRIPSVEQAKIRSLIEGGVGMRVQYEHQRSNDYANMQRTQSGGLSQSRESRLTTKSCDNIFVRHRAAPESAFVWRDATRSEEQLFPPPQSGVKSKLSALLKKLSPRPLRSKSQPSAWVVVEFGEGVTSGGRLGSLGGEARCEVTVELTSQRSTSSSSLHESLRKQTNRPRSELSLSASEICVEQSERTVAPQIHVAVSEPRVKRRYETNRQARPRTSRNPGGIVVRADRLKVASRPLSLLLPGGDARQRRRMASVESIGSCSLDADATASVADSELYGCGSVSERTLHSLNLSSKTPDTDLSSKKTGSTTPEYVKRTAKLFESETDESADDRTFAEPPRALETQVLINGIKESVAKKPSYLNLACSISGYTTITNYDSKLREGFRSRDQSPGRALIKSRDVSPLRSGQSYADTVGLRSDCGNFLAAPGVAPYRANGDAKSTNGGTVHALNGKGKMAEKRDASSTPSSVRESSRTFMSTMLSTNGHTSTSCEVTSRFQSRHAAHESPNGAADGRSPSAAANVVEYSSQSKSVVANGNGTATYAKFSETKSHFMESRCDPGRSSNGDATAEWTGSASNNKSFIQQRVERLYGPGALAQGFFRRSSGVFSTASESASANQFRNSNLLLDKKREDLETLNSGSCNKEKSKQSEKQLSAASCTSNGQATNGQTSNGQASNGETLNGQASLPVLRHLRPEFRAQLALSPSARHQGKPAAPVESMPVVVPDVLPAAPEVLLPVEKPKKIAVPPAAPTPAPSAADEPRDGTHFLRLLAAETTAILALADLTERDMERDLALLSEEAQGRLRAAIGQARLLVKQKLQQFEGLCHKNLAQSPDEAFPTTSDDLAGFWDMVQLQIRQVHALFAELAQAQAAGWPSDPVPTAPTAAAGDAVDGGKRRPVAKRAPVKVKATPASEELRKAREEARAKMMEQRRKEMKERAAAADGVEIFVPENGK